MLTWVSHNFQLTFADLGDALSGYMSIENNEIYDNKNSARVLMEHWRSVKTKESELRVFFFAYFFFSFS